MTFASKVTLGSVTYYLECAKVLPFARTHNSKHELQNGLTQMAERDRPKTGCPTQKVEWKSQKVEKDDYAYPAT